ncbi:hypothetical protein H012_gp882 [Acanthamoeba polyphaga moumouvirus]|uniref:Proliferating cell nuclear antigen n=1 Tax=Acanthamoeba polyphaga moumouvirus TaxID=1269028 RepID=L7RB14_9VIRU|nr:hypothetical protein H012_gp882 [Acanthamoeba polyphaga moumouvirus]AGC01584.1 hypothetical protein Moumou_00036 [Acanthamoeba polyphaga moumouvirus]
MQNTTENFLELVIEKEHVSTLKYTIEIVCSHKSCKIIFDSSTCEDKNKSNIILISQDENKNSVFRAEINATKLRYFNCSVPKVNINVCSQLLANGFSKISSNDPVIIYIKNTKDELFFYNLDKNNNHY